MTRSTASSPDRITQRLMTVLLLLLGVLGIGLAGRSDAQSVQPAVTNRWAVYGTPFTNERDRAVPGDGVVVVQPRAQPGDPWSSGAGMPIPHAITAGERVTAVFWARAARPTRLAIALQANAAPYPRFGAADVTLTRDWRQVSVGGTARTGFAANTQSLSVALGRAGAEVRLGPVAFLRGPTDRATIARAFAGFRPAEVTVDVHVASDRDVVLAGTLHLPAGHGDGPFPLAVLIQGHGPNGRGGFTGIVERLTADGIAALEYDKRGIGRSTGTYKEDVERLTADAVAAVAAMRRRPEIDARRIALVGHSQGGVIAPAVAAADPTIASVVTLAGSVGDGLVYLGRALRHQLIAAGRPEAAVTPAVDAAMTLLQARVGGANPPTITRLRTEVVNRFAAAGFPRAQAEGALALIDTEEARTAHKLRSASDLRSLRIPVLAVFGAKDPQVGASAEAPAARAALAANRWANVVVLDGLSHWFQEGAKTGAEAEVATLGPNLGSPRVVALVGDWLRATLIPRTGEAGGRTR